MTAGASPVKTLLKAAWIATMDRVPFRAGAIVFTPKSSSVPLIGNGYTAAFCPIVGVGTATEMRREHPDAVVEDLGNVVLMPGLVNAHTHLELSDMAPAKKPAAAPSPSSGPPTGGDRNLAHWLLNLMQSTAATTSEQLPAVVAKAIVTGIQQCLGFGTTCIGDISRQCHLSRPLLRTSPLRINSYGEIQAMGQRRSLLESRLAVALDQAQAAPRLRIGLTPHAPYTVEPNGYRRCLDLASAAGLPLATHLAESPDEAAFLSRHGGPFRDLWQAIDAWDDHVPSFDGGPIRFVHCLGLLDYPTLLAHVNYVDDAELAILAAGQASVVYCPRTHAYFGHPPHRWRDMLARGINVAFGTDSCASSPDLNLLEELRMVHRIAPDVPALDLWQMVTLNAAKALLRPEAGRLAPGCAADFVAFPAANDHPLLDILETCVRPQAVWIDGLILAAPTCESPPESSR